ITGRDHGVRTSGFRAAHGAVTDPGERGEVRREKYCLSLRRTRGELAVFLAHVPRCRTVSARCETTDMGGDDVRQAGTLAAPARAARMRARVNLSGGEDSCLWQGNDDCASLGHVDHNSVRDRLPGGPGCAVGVGHPCAWAAPQYD